MTKQKQLLLRLAKRIRRISASSLAGGRTGWRPRWPS
jgi:hypothetical protein